MKPQTARRARLSLAITTGLSIVSIGACNGHGSSSAMSDSARGNSSASGTASGMASGADTVAATGTAFGAISGTEAASGSSAASANLDTTVDMGATSSELASRFKGLADANYAALVDEANNGEIEAAKVAETKGSNSAVKAFAKRMISDHTSLLSQGQQLSKQLGVTPQPPADDPVRQLNSQTMQALQSTAKGSSFDSTYITSQVAAHKAVLGLLSAIESGASNAQLQAMARKARPMIQSHLDSAQAIQQTQGSPPM
jgi:putative membrane protein